jgi:GT2 family glycosyltransferase
LEDLFLIISKISLIIISLGIIGILVKIKTQGRVGNKFFGIMIIFWSLVISITINPNILDSLINSTGLDNRAQFLLIISIGIIIYTLYAQTVKNKNISGNFHLLIRKTAVDNFRREFKNEIDESFDVLIVITAKDEEKTIGNVIDNINSLKPSFSYRILIVNDGSSDNTEKISREKNTLVANHIFNLGIGAATKTGFYVAKILEPKIIINIDADGQHDPKFIPQMISKINDDGMEMVYGSRFHNEIEYETTMVRSVGNKFYTKLVNKITGLSLTDVNTGYRAISLKKLDSIFFLSETNFAIELAIRAAKNKLKITEIPTLSITRAHGQSQFHKIEKFFLYNINVQKQIFKANYRKKMPIEYEILEN